MRKNSKLQSEREDIETRQPPLYLTHVGAKTSGKKTPATDSLSCNEKSQKEYVPEDPNLVPNSSDSSSRNSDFSEDSNYESIRRENNK